MMRQGRPFSADAQARHAQAKVVVRSNRRHGLRAAVLPLRLDPVVNTRARRLPVHLVGRTLERVHLGSAVDKQELLVFIFCVPPVRDATYISERQQTHRRCRSSADAPFSGSGPTILVTIVFLSRAKRILYTSLVMR